MTEHFASKGLLILYPLNSRVLIYCNTWRVQIHTLPPKNKWCFRSQVLQFGFLHLKPTYLGTWTLRVRLWKQISLLHRVSGGEWEIRNDMKA